MEQDADTDADADASSISETQVITSNDLHRDFEHLEVHDAIDQKFRMVAARIGGTYHNSHDKDTSTSLVSDANTDANANTDADINRKASNNNGHDRKLNRGQNTVELKKNNIIPLLVTIPNTTTTTTTTSKDNNESKASTKLLSTEEQTNAANTNTNANANPATRSPSKKPQTKNYNEEQFDKVISSPVVDIADLRKLAWNGIPAEHRPQTWKILLGYLPTNISKRMQTLKRKRAEYRDAIAQHYDIDDHSRTMQEQETLRQVLVDVPRTAPDVPLFRNAFIRQSLARLLYIWAMRHPASSYVQGINDLATPLIAVFLSEYFEGDVLQAEDLEDLTPEILENVEADVYWCLTNLLAGIQDHYTQDQPGVQRMVMKLEELVQRIDAGLTRHLKETEVQFMQFAFRWMNCLLMREFNLQCIIRLWDTYLAEGDGGFETFHVYVCASFLCQFSGELQGMQFDELFAFMQNIPTNEWDDGKIEIVLSQAFVLSTLFQGSAAHLTSPSPK